MNPQLQQWTPYADQFAAERHREEIDWTLNAIAGALVTNRLPPDDAFAWARIAAREATALTIVRGEAAQ